MNSDTILKAFLIELRRAALIVVRLVEKIYPDYKEFKVPF